MVLFLCKILLEVKMKGEMFNMNIEELNTQLEYLDETKSLIKQAIIDKGQSISENDTFRSFVQKINDIETGVETANIPIWYSEAGISTSNPIEYEIENKTPISAWVMDKTTQLTRVDDYSTIRTIPEVGDLYIAISGFSRNNATEYYICLYQIEEITESGNELNLIVVPLVGERQDNFCTAIGLNTNVLKSGTTILGVQGKSTIVDTEEDNNAATSNDMASGKIAYVNGQKLTGTLREVLPTTDGAPTFGKNQSIEILPDEQPEVGDYDGNHIYISSQMNDDEPERVLRTNAKSYTDVPKTELATAMGLTSDKIKAGEKIIGVSGKSTVVDTEENSNAITASNVLLDKVAFVNGQKITGTMANQGKISIFPNSNAVEKSSAYHTWVKVPADTETELYRTCYKLSDMIVNGQPNSIPNTYELLEYLEGTGTQYIKLPFPTLNTNISNGNYNVYLDAQFTDLSPRDSGSLYHLEGIGSMSSSAMDFYKAELYIGWKQETAGTQYFYYSNCDNDDWDSTTPADTQRHLFEINSKSSTGSGDKGLYIDGIKVHSDGPTVSTCKYKYNYCLFGYENANGVWCNKIKIYSCTIKKVQDGSTLYELVPVIRKSDNVLGMYDVTNNRFYTNNGSGTFQYGEF